MKLIFYLLDCVLLTSTPTRTLNLPLNYCCTLWEKLLCIDVRMPSSAIRIPSIWSEFVPTFIKQIQCFANKHNLLCKEKLDFQTIAKCFANTKLYLRENAQICMVWTNICIVCYNCETHLPFYEETWLDFLTHVRADFLTRAIEQLSFPKNLMIRAYSSWKSKISISKYSNIYIWVSINDHPYSINSGYLLFFETTIMGKTADLAMIQKTNIDTLHKEGKSQKVITERCGCLQSAVSKHIKCKVDWKEEFG